MAGFIKHMSIAAKLWTTFGLVLALALGLAIAAVSGVRQVDAAGDETISNWLPSTRILGQLELLLTDKRRSTAAGQVLDSAAMLSRQAESLRDQVDRFLGGVRAA